MQNVIPKLKEEEEETLLIYAAQGSPFRRKKLSVINGNPEQQRQCVHYAAGVNDVESVNPVVPIPTVENTGTYLKGGIDKHVI